MAKLDLSALKKQNITNVILLNDPADITSPPPSQETGTTVIEIPPVASSVTPESEPIGVKIEDPVPKTRLSLSSFKKTGTVSPTWAPPVSDSSMATPISAAVVATDVGGNSKPSIEENILPIAGNPVTHQKASSSEFFPNLGFENNKLFSDIVAMGTFWEANAEVAVKKNEEIPLIAQSDEGSMSSNLTEVLEVNDMSHEILTITPSSVVDWSSESVIPSTVVSISVEEPLVNQLERENSMKAPEASPSVVSSVSLEPMEVISFDQNIGTVAKDLSKDRKGWLAALFDNKKKVLFGLSAIVISLGVVGLLFWMGNLGVTWGSKANVIESPQVAVKSSATEETPKETVSPETEETPKETVTPETEETPKETVTPATEETPKETVTSATEETPKDVTESDITASGAIPTVSSSSDTPPEVVPTSSINTFRAPNVSAKRLLK